ncbi:hypothetical protein CMV_022049 [Castanea mollissima]|uniref:Uncharacterized protein n=1 Tax=Castanea mollissima TaxID=60419 RepID=A0A8J4QT69_9ROSI|nr:hypothetical protein CMV_022049 [Castanea mollissima]
MINGSSRRDLLLNSQNFCRSIPAGAENPSLSRLCYRRLWGSRNRRALILGWAYYLDAFSSYPLRTWLPSVYRGHDNWYTRGASFPLTAGASSVVPAPSVPCRGARRAHLSRALARRFRVRRGRGWRALERSAELPHVGAEARIPRYHRGLPVCAFQRVVKGPAAALDGNDRTRPDRVRVSDLGRDALGCVVTGVGQGRCGRDDEQEGQDCPS